MFLGGRLSFDLLSKVPRSLCPGRAEWKYHRIVVILDFIEKTGLWDSRQPNLFARHKDLLASWLEKGG